MCISVFKKKWYTSIEEAEKIPQKVKYLRLWHIDVSKYCGRFSQFIHVKHLDISWSPTTKLPTDIASLKQLNILRILNVPLQEFPEWICSLSKLRELTVRGTEIRVIPSDISQLQHLKRLEIGNNNLSYLPQEIGQLEHLKELYAPDNQLSSIPDAFRKLTRLKRFGLARNCFPESEANKIRQWFPGIVSIWSKKE